MTGWSTQAVLAAAAAWTWVPPGSANVRTGDYLLTAFPGHLRASFPVEVQWSDSDRPAGELIRLRGKGAYRAVLARRLALAREHGATLALVKGRDDTSAPILRRAGFAVYGEQRCYRLDVTGGAG